MAKKRDFDAFYYGVGMKLDQASVDKAGEQLEGKLNQVVEDISKEVKKMVLAVNAGMKEIDPTGLNKAIEAVGGDLDELADFNPKKLKAQIGDLQRDFKGLEGRIGSMSDKLESSFNKVNDLITSVSNRLSSIEIITPKLGKDALKKDIAEMTKVARGFSNLFASGQKDIPTDALDAYVKKVKDGIASMKASGNDMELFVDGDLAKDLVRVLGVLREMGAPVSSLHTELFEVVHSMRSAFKDAGITEAFRDVGYQIDEVGHSLGILTSRIKPYEDEIKRLKGLVNDWQKDLAKSDAVLLSSFQTKATTENFDVIIAQIKEYEKIIHEIGDPSDVKYQSIMSNMLALVQATEKQMESMGKKKVTPFLTMWTEAFNGSDLQSGNKLSTSYLEFYRQDIQDIIDGIKNDDKYKELEGLITQRQERLARLMSQVESINKAGRPQGTKNTPKKTTELTGEKIVVSPTLKIDQKKWTADINTALKNIVDSGKLKPIDLRINTQSKNITEDLNKIRQAINEALAGTRGQTKDAEGNKKSGYISAFDKSFEQFKKRLTTSKTEILPMISQWQKELKEAFRFNLSVDGLENKKKAASEVGSFVLTYIENLNEAFEKNPIRLHSNINELIEKIKSQVKDIKIEGEVGITAGDINKSGLDINANTGGLAQDHTVRQIYDLLASRSGGVYAGTPIYMGAIPTNSGTPTDVKTVEEKAKAEEKGAEAVERKVAAEEKAADTSKKTTTPIVKTNGNSDNQQIYNELHSSIKNQLDSFSDVDSALKWVKPEIEKYSKTISQAEEGSEEYIKAQIGLTDLLNQWRYKVGNASKSKEPFRYEKYLGAGNKQGWANWSKYLKEFGIEQLLPEDFKITSKTKFHETYGLEEPKTSKKASSSNKSKKIEESAEEMIARDFEQTKEIANHILKLAKWAKALGTIADGLDYTITEADFKDRDTVSRNGVTYTKQDLEKSGGKIFSQGSRLTADVLDEFVAEYENSEDEEFKELFSFVKKLIDVQRTSQGKLDAILKDLDGTDIATKYGAADDKSEYLAKNIKSTFVRLMGKNANKTAQTAATEILSKYGMTDSFQKLATLQNPEEIFKTLQDNVLNDANIDKMIGELSALDGNVGKTYQNFINLLKIAKEFMLTSNSISTIGQEARNWIGGTKERRDKYKKVVDKRTGRTITTDEVIGVEDKVIKNGIRQMIQEFKAIFINEAGERILGFNDGKGIVDNFVGGNASFTKIINALENALEEAADIQLDRKKGAAKDYSGVRKHERVADIIDAEATPTYITGIVKKTESETIAQQIKKSQEQKQKAEEDLNRLRTELNETVSDAEVVSRLLDVSAQKDTQRQSIVVQKNKIDSIQNNIQVLENQLVTPVESFESIQTQLLQKQEALLDMQKKWSAMPNITENDQEAKEKFKEQIKKEQSAIARLQERAREAQRTYEEGIVNRLIEEQTLNIESLEKMVAEKSANQDIIDKRIQVGSLTESRQNILDHIANASSELTNMKPQLSSAQQELIQKYETYIGKANDEIKIVLKTIKELEKKGVPKDDGNFIVAQKEVERLEKYKATFQDLISKEKGAPKGEYTQAQLTVRQQKEAELIELRKQSATIWTEEQPLVAELASYDKEIKFLQDMIETKRKYIESLRDGLQTKKVMSTPNEIKIQLSTKTQELAQAQSEQEKLQAEYASIQGSEDEIINRELEELRSRKAQKEARIKEIDAINNSSDNAELQNERKNLEIEIAQIDKHINEGLVQTIVRIQAELVATQETLDRANSNLAGQESRLKGADNSTAIYTKGGKVLSQVDANNLLPQAQTRLEYEIKQIDTILNAYLLQKTEALTELTAKAVGGEINPSDAKALKAEMVNIKSLSDNLSSGTIKEEEYVNKVAAAYVAMQKVMGEVNESAARANAERLATSVANKQSLEKEILLLKERAAIEDPTVVTKTVDKASITTENNTTKPKVNVQPEIQPGEVAKEVRENIAQAPATVAVQPTVVTNGAYTSSGQVVQAVLGGQGLATERNQQTIIELLKSGIKVNGKAGSTSDQKDGGSGNKEEKGKKTPKIPSTGRVDAQADEINKLTNINKDSNVYKRYESMMAQLNDALKQAEEKGDAFTTKDADRIRGLMTNISGLGRKIIEASSAFEQLRERGVSTTEYIEDGVKSLEAEMLNMAHNDALSKNALLTDVAYDDVKQRMTYVLTDLEGSTTRVTMAYNEMFGSIVTTADKTTDSVRKVYRTVESEMTKMVQSGNLVDDLTGNSALKNSGEYKAYTKIYENMMKAANDVRAKGTLATQEEKNELIALVKQVETARIAFEKLAKASSDFDNKIEGKAVGMTDGQNLETQMKNFVLSSQPWTVAQRKMIEDTWKFNNAQNSAAYSVEKNKGQLASMSVVADMGTKRIGQYTQETKKYQSGMEKFMDSLKNKWQEVARYLMTFGSMYRVFAILRQGITYVREIDKALTELKKVTDETEESYERFLNTAAKTADRVGSTIKEIVSSTADWARLGYSLQEAATLAESTSVLLNVSEFQSIDEATSALTSTLQAFSYTAEQSMDVVDILNEVGNNFAISSDGIATALKDSASSLVAANNSYEEAVALIAAANRVVQDPNSVGAALRTISLRLRSTSVKELEEAGEDTEGAITSKSKLQSKVKGLTGVDILTDIGSYRSTYDILLDISKVWKDISDVDQAVLLEIIAGKTRSNTAAAILSNTKDLEKALLTAQEAEGSALRENEKYLDSIQGKIDQFNNSVQTMWSNTLDSDAVKWFIELGTQIVKIVDFLGLIPSILVTIATISMIKNKMGPIQFFTELFNGLQKIPGKISKFAKSFVGISTATSELTAATLEQAVANNTITTSEAIRQATTNSLVLSQVSLTEAEAMAALSTTTLNEAEKQAIVNKLGLSSATTTLTMATLSQAVAEGKITAAEAMHLGVATGLMTAQASLTSTKAVDILVSQGLTAAHAEELAAKLGLTTATTVLTAAKIKQLTIDGILTPAESALAMSLLKTGGAATTAATGFKALWTALWPILAIMVAIQAVMALWEHVLDPIINKTENLQEELDEMKSNLSDVRSELDSVNQELETTNGRMEELLAKDRLTFVEQEELDKLKETNAELERRKDMLEAQEQYERERVGRQAAAVVNSKREEIGWVLNGKSEEEEVYDDIEEYLEVKKEIADIERQLSNKNLSSSEREDLNEDLKDLKEDLDSEKADVTDYIDVLTEALSGVEYGDSVESDAALDYYNELLGYWNVKQGTPNAKSNEVKNILNKKEFSDTKTDLEEYVQGLKDVDQEATDYITSIITNNTNLVNDLTARGLQAQDAIDYFTSLASDVEFETIEGKTEEIRKVTEKLEGAFNNIGQFMKGDQVDTTAIAEYFKGTSEATRTEIARLIKNIHDGEISVAQALKSFATYGMIESWKIIEAEISELNTEVFKDLGEDISGIIDTVKELSSAFESVASSIELVDKAQAEMAYSGHLSVETALQLMESADDWTKVLEIEEGNIKLVAGAEEALVQTKLDLIKTNLQTALSTVEAQLAQITATEASADMAYTIEESTNLAVTQLAGNMAYLTEMMTAYTRAAAGENVDMSAVTKSAEAAKKAVLDATNYEKNAAEAIGREELEKEKARLEAMLGIVENADTPSEFRSNYYSDEVSGGNADKDSAEDDLFQREMDYWENRIAANQAKYEQLQNEIDLLEAKGQKADASFYEEQIELENKRKWLLEQQKLAAQAHLATLEEGSEEWWEVANTLNDIEGELDDVTASIVDLQDAIGEIDTYKFEEFNTRLDNLTNKLETIRNLIAPDGEENWFDDEGNWTEAGVAVLGSQLQSLEMYKQGYQETMDELAQYEPDYKGNKAYYEALGIHSEQEWYDKTEELISQQYDFAQSISDTEQSVVDMYESSIDAVEEYTETLIDSYNDYIDSVKEALDAERDLYDFKRKIEDQSKSVAETERKIAALSGSTNAADVAERRRLQSTLYDQQRDLEDSYRDHSAQSQQEALDKEAEAYETAMTNMIDGLRTSLEEATRNMDEFLMGVTSMVMYNADTVLAKYEETNLPLTSELTNPWEEAKKAVGAYSGNALDLMNQWTKEGGFFAQFNSTGTTNLKSPWSAGTTAATNFQTDVGKVMTGVVTNISSNVKTASGELSKLYQQIQDTEKRASDANVVVSGSGSGGSGGYVAPQKKYYVNAFLDMGGRSLSVTKSGSTVAEAMSAAKIAILGEYEKVKGNSASAESSWLRSWKNKVKYTTQHYAKGISSTPRDEWAMTDEPQFGDELVLVPGKDGNLSFMRKGTGVVPADMTQKLFELARIPTSDLMNKNLTAIVPNITKNDFKNEFNFESLVHVDTVDSDTLPKLEKMVDKKIDDFSRALNYSLKKFSR